LSRPPDADDDEPTETAAVVDPPTAERPAVRAAETLDDAGEPPGETSGSIDISMSDSRLVKIPEPGSKPPRKQRTSQMAVEKVEDVVSDGVGKVGVGVGVVGAGLTRFGERVDRLPGMHRTKLGTGVAELGAGLSEVGANLTELPKVARTKRGRVLIRSLVVGFALVFAWIAVIVFLQLRGGEKPDLRKDAETVMVMLRDGQFSKLFAESSPRFQEITDYDSFERTMQDMNRTLGTFREIAAVNDTVVSRGPGGLVARVDLSLDFERGRAHATISMHKDGGVWKFLGIGVDLPDDLIAKETSRAARDERVKAPPEVRVAAERVLELSRDGTAGEIWDTAAPLFQKTVSRADFERIEAERHAALGRYQRILDETKSMSQPTDAGSGSDAGSAGAAGSGSSAGSAAAEKPSTTGGTSPGGSYAWLTALVQYDNAVVSSSFGFSWIEDTWKLSSYVVVLPMPRAPRSPGAPAPAATGSPIDAAPR
jgi:hypothetical protein